MPSQSDVPSGAEAGGRMVHADKVRVLWWRTVRAEQVIPVVALALPSAFMLTVGWSKFAEVSGAWKLTPPTSTGLVIVSLALVWRSRYFAGGLVAILAALICQTGLGIISNLLVLLVAGALLVNAMFVAVRKRGASTG